MLVKRGVLDVACNSEEGGEGQCTFCIPSVFIISSLCYNSEINCTALLRNASARMRSGSFINCSFVKYYPLSILSINKHFNIVVRVCVLGEFVICVLTACDFMSSKIYKFGESAWLAGLHCLNVILK